MESIVQKAQEVSIREHAACGHKYGSLPYSQHLEDVFYTGLKFIYLVDRYEHENVLAALWLHDMIEDCRWTYNDVKEEFNVKVAELVYAVTNEKGRNRAERANDKYYQGIVDCQNAVFIKLCDRIANVESSSTDRHVGMFKKYKEENHNFLVKLKLAHPDGGLYGNKFNDLASHLCKVLSK